MNILITTPIFPPEIGGPATYVSELCERLKKHHDLTVVAFGEKINSIEDVPVHAIPIHYKWFGPFRRQYRLYRTILREARNADLVYAQGPFVVGLMSCFAARRLHKPLVIKFVGDLVWENAFGQGRTTQFLDDFLTRPATGLVDRIKLKIQGWVFRRASAIVVPSEFLKSIVVRHYRVPASHVQVVYNAVTPPHVHPKPAAHPTAARPKKAHSKPGLSGNVTRLLTIGRLVKWKRIDGILEALHKLNRPDIHLTVIGSGPEESVLKQHARTLNLESHVHFIGKQPRDVTLKHLAHADFFILNSVYEGLPHTVIEAMLLKIPVMATNIPGTTEIAIRDKTAYLTNVDDPSDLARTLRRALDRPQDTDRLTRAAFVLVNERFNWENNLARLQKVWRDARSGPPKKLTP